MSPADEKLAERCAAIAETASAGAEWIDRNREQLRAEAEVAIKDLRRTAYVARRLETAARRKMCVGVFGPSQSGKSYLISALARSGQERLIADFGGELIDFIRDINPEGGRESTGLITRFTIDPALALPSGHAVQLRLLTQTDIVKILGNTFFADCKQSSLADPEPADISAAIDKIAARAGAPAGDLSEDEVLDCQEYFEKYFDANSRVKVLRRAYWQRAAALAPRLRPADRAALFGLIWGEVGAFTQLFLTFHQALAALGFADEAFCSTAALVPKQTSIIDVAMLARLGNDDPDSLEVVTREGRSVVLPRSTVTGLTAELRIVMQKKPYDFFDHTDLLDFPGARSREEIRDIDAQLAKPEGLKDFFLRGKVSYLFERYSANLELNTMLLCIGPSNQEVRGLPEIVAHWIAATHGATPEERAKKPDTALFFVLTQFDREFERKADWEATLSTRWSTRLFSSMLDFFGKYHSWPREWTPG
ncbi:MAG: type III effector HopL1, partial [Alphaproteobacteria bacterium]|nr:type III effector HopL1 [Alphaproteobacteria bacterium]